MQKFVTVDMYGGCSGVELKRNSEQRTLSTYKFYLSFENSLCPEYATEKIYKIINLKLTDNPPVPVVMGPNRSWYEKALPKNSFIHVDDFSNPKDLSQYLEYLNVEPDLYFEYLKWRRNYQLVHDPPLRCNLCEFLNNKTLKTDTEPIIISDFEQFWKKQECA